MSRPIGTGPLPSPPVITMASRLSQGAGLIRSGAGTPSSGVSPWSDAANTVQAFEFTLEATTTFYKGFATTGSAPASNFNIGLYDENYSLIASTGSVASGAVALVPVVGTLSGTPRLPPGLYYAGMLANATTTNLWCRWSVATFGAELWQSMGCWKYADDVTTLDATAVPADITNVAFPLFGLITRSVFDV